jgi:hypothetical protein
MTSSVPRESTMRLDTGTAQDALRSLASAKSDLGEIHQWLMTNVVGDDVLPRQMPSEVSRYLNAASRNIEIAETELRKIADERTSFLLTVLQKQQNNTLLTENEYYLLRANGLMTGVPESDSEFHRYLQSVGAG